MTKTDFIKLKMEQEEVKAKSKKKIWLLPIKIIVSFLAIYTIVNNIEWDEVLPTLLICNKWLLIAALFLYALSKAASSYRLNRYFREIPVDISEKNNLRLYWLGMFYNLFLPGGIGGDGYKIYLIGKTFQVKLKTTTAAVLIDRLNGMSAILYILPASFLFVPFPVWVKLAVPFAIALIYVCYRIFLRFVFPRFLKSEPYCSGLSIVVQSLQCIAIFAILQSLGVDKDYAEYTILFLISSLVSVLPISIGGIGLRELVFMAGSSYFSLNPTLSVLVSFIFYMINVIVSFAGIYYHFSDFQLNTNEEIV